MTFARQYPHLARAQDRAAANESTSRSMVGVAEKIGRDLGIKIGDRLVAAAKAQGVQQPLKFRGNVPIAQMTRDEAEAFAEQLPFVGEYANNAEGYAAAGMTLVQFVSTRLNDELGCPYHGQSHVSDALRSALLKQGEKFSASYRVG